MPIPVAEALDEQAALGASKAASLRRPVAFAVAAALAGGFVGVGVVLLLSVAGPFAASGIVSSGPLAELLAETIAVKDSLGLGELFWRAVLCNALVCLGLWMAARTRSDAAKLIVLWWALLGFVASGFGHSVANMTTFSLGVFTAGATWDQLARNLAVTIPGNLVGGALVVGGACVLLGRSGGSESSNAADVTSD